MHTRKIPYHKSEIIMFLQTLFIKNVKICCEKIKNCIQECFVKSKILFNSLKLEIKKNLFLFVWKASSYADQVSRRERCTHTLHGWMATFYQKARQSTIH